MALTKHDPPALNGCLDGAVIRSFSFTPSVWQSSFSFFSLRPPQLSVSLSQRLLHTFPRWLALPLPCSLSLTFFPLCSSLQRGEKHTCQIQVGHHTVSHPHQLLSTRRFDANKFFSIAVWYCTAPVSFWDEMVHATAVQCQCPCDRAASVPRWSCSDLFHRRVNYWKRLLVLSSDYQEKISSKLFFLFHWK